MSLLVNAYKRDGADKMIFLDPDDHAKEMAGFEAFRKTFYGGRAARSLGLRLVPKLSDADLYCEGDDLATLQHEVDLISRNVELFTDEAGADRETLQFRLDRKSAKSSSSSKLMLGIESKPRAAIGNTSTLSSVDELPFLVKWARSWTRKPRRASCVKRV